MSERQVDELDNEVVRHIFRKRDSIIIGESDPFEDDWPRIFHVGGERYCLSRRYTQYGLVYTFYARADHWEKKTHFRPADHLMNTLWDLIEDLAEKQYAQRQAASKASILGRSAIDRQERTAQ